MEGYLWGCSSRLEIGPGVRECRRLGLVAPTRTSWLSRRPRPTPLANPSVNRNRW